MKHPLQQLMAALLISKLPILLFLCLTPMLACTDPDIAGHRWMCYQDSDCGAGWICLEGVCEPEGSIPTNPDDFDSGCETDETETEPEDDAENTDAPSEDVDIEEETFDTEPSEIEPDIETDRTDPELPPTCEDHDNDGFPGTGDGCNPRDPAFDCDDGNENINPDAQETCDNEDNDCDRLIDNTDTDLATPPCPLSAGVCAGLHTVCDNGQLVGCAEEDYLLYSGGTYTRIEDGNNELCDDLDNDCDDIIDENMERECYTGEPGTRDKGICRGGLETCNHGSWEACVDEITPDPEGNNINCDGLDNDCDDTVDEECECVYDEIGSVTQTCYTGPDGTLDVGICHGGTQECLSNDRWGPCTGDQTPQAETCANTGEDDNCDGNQDNVPSLGVGCIDDTQDGICQNGEYRCRGDSLECISTTPSGDEACDNMGADDDCNGTLDDIGQLGDGCINEAARGICRDGTLQCRGAALTCVSTIDPGDRDEECNALDDDCDGTPDDDVVCILPHASSTCAQGDCRIEACDDHAFDEDQVDENGCEVWCDETIDVDSLGVEQMGEVWGDNSAVWNGETFGVAYTREVGEQREIFFAEIGHNGSPENDVRVTYHAGDSIGPSLAWSGNGYGVVWKDDRSGDSEIYFARLSPEGIKQGDDIRITNNPSEVWFPSIAWTEYEFGIVWHDDRNTNWEIYFARLSPEGIKQGDDIRITNNPASSQRPSLVWVGEEYAVVWDDYRDDNSEIYFARLSPEGIKQGDDIRITTGPSTSWLPSIAWTGSEFGVTWHDYRDGTASIYFARLSPEGIKQNADVVITNDSAFIAYPALVWREEHGLIWKNSQNVAVFTRLNRDGFPKGAAIPLGYATCGAGYVSIAASTDRYIVIWENAPGGACQVDYTVFECDGE